MNLNLKAEEEKLIAAVRNQWDTLSTDAREEIAAVIAKDLGYINAHPLTYSLIVMGIGAVLVELVRGLLGAP